MNNVELRTLVELSQLMKSVRAKLERACGLTVRQCTPTDQQNDHFTGFMSSGAFIKIFVCDKTQKHALHSAASLNNRAYERIVGLIEQVNCVAEKRQEDISILKELQDLRVQADANTKEINYLRYWIALEGKSVHATLMSEHTSDVWSDLPVIMSGFNEMQF